MKLFEDQIDFLEKFIQENENPNCSHCLSIQDGYNGIKTYNEILNADVSTYIIFGGSGFGYTCYSLYKSQNNTIYFICVNLQTPQYCCKVNNINFFDKFV
jgi:hypothetical protein